MCSVPWSSETERADYYQNLYNEQLAICDRLEGHLQRYIAEVEKLERYRDDTQIEVSKDEVFERYRRRTKRK